MVPGALTEAQFTDVPGRHYTNCGFTICSEDKAPELDESSTLAEVRTSTTASAALQELHAPCLALALPSQLYTA